MKIHNHMKNGLFLPYLLVYFGGRLGVAEGYRGHILEDGHLDGAVTPVKEGHQWAGVHTGPIGYGWPDVV